MRADQTDQTNAASDKRGIDFRQKPGLRLLVALLTFRVRKQLAYRVLVAIVQQ